MTNAPIIDLDTFKLGRGCHNSINDGGCLLELCSYLADEPWSDRPSCVSPVLAALGRSFNDALGERERQLLLPFARRMLNTAGDGQDEARGWLAADWLVHTATPAWLDLAGATEAATSLRALPPINSANAYSAARPLLRSVRDTARQKCAEFREKFKAEFIKQLKKKAPAGAAEAAWAAGAAEAAGAAWAAGAAEAAGAAGAAWAAWAAEAAGAAWAAGAGYSAIRKAVMDALKPKFEEALRPTADALLPSALDLLNRMIDPSAHTEAAA